MNKKLFIFVWCMIFVVPKTTCCEKLLDYVLGLPITPPLVNGTITTLCATATLGSAYGCIKQIQATFGPKKSVLTRLVHVGAAGILGSLAGICLCLSVQYGRWTIKNIKSAYKNIMYPETSNKQQNKPTYFENIPEEQQPSTHKFIGPIKLIRPISPEGSVSH
jgi:hypothetical protein